MVISPVLLCAHSRPVETKAVIRELRAVRAPKVYLFVDGPAPGAETANLQVRELVSEFDWDCQVITRLNDVNLGVREAIPAAISWFFEEEEEGIILEDDCVPSSTFFPFASYLLDKFRDHDSIWAINGSNLHSSEAYLTSVMTSRYLNVWGWATWRNRWREYSLTPPYLTSPRRAVALLGRNFKSRLFPLWLFFLLSYEMARTTWDYQAALLMAEKKMFSLVPSTNLISNVGYDGSHDMGSSPWLGLSVFVGERVPFDELRLISGEVYDESVLSDWMGLRPPPAGKLFGFGWALRGALGTWIRAGRERRIQRRWIGAS